MQDVSNVDLIHFDVDVDWLIDEIKKSYEWKKITKKRFKLMIQRAYKFGWDRRQKPFYSIDRCVPDYTKVLK